MKRIATLIFLLFAFAGCTKDPAPDKGPGTGPAPGRGQESFVDGVFRIKVRDGAGELDTRAFTRNGGSGMAAFDAAATRAGATAVSHVFSDGGRFRERRRKAGLHLWYDVTLTNGISVKDAMAQFEGVDGIETVEPVYRMVPDGSAGGSFTYSRAGYAPPFNDPLLGNQWIYHNDGSLPNSIAGADINLFPAWTVCKGHSGVIVAIVDGGIEWTHPDLKANMWYDEDLDAYGRNFCTDSYTLTPSTHGTHVAGTVSAVNSNGIGVCGIAGGDGTPGSGVRLMSCQIFEEEGVGHGADFAEVLTWSADHGAVISQNSWSYPTATGLSSSAKKAIDYFIEYAGFDENGVQTGPMAGGIIIFSAGNYYTSTPVFPAAYEKVIAVGSIGPNFEKAPSSSYGPWIDLVATGGYEGVNERYRTFSTVTTEDGLYGYAAGTSMAAPQVSGIAALAVAKYGTQGPGFTNTMLWDLLVGSGRKDEVENHNPGLKGMFGAGLVDAEYVFFSDNVPQPITSLSSAGRRYHVQLEWKTPESWLGQPTTGYEVFTSTQPLSGCYDQIAAAALRHETGTTSGSIGSTATHTVHGLEPSADYYFAVFSVSKYGTPSEPAFIAAKTSHNSPPSPTKPLPGIYLGQTGNANKTTVDLTGYFTDPDMPTDKLTYFVSYSTGGVAECRLEESDLIITPVGKGSVTLTVVAQDLDGEVCTSGFTVVVNSATAIDLYPNPFRDVLNVRIPDAEGDFKVAMYNQAGQKVLDSTVSITQGSTGAIDMTRLSPGNYTFVLDYFGNNMKKSVVKR